MITVAFDSSPLTEGHKYRGMGAYTRHLLEQLSEDKELDIKQFESGQAIPKADLVHYPYFDLFNQTLHLKRGLPTVVTIPDVVPLLYPKHYPPGIKGSFNLWRQKRVLKNVESVITISEISKKDVSKFLSIKPDKISAIYLAPDDKFKVINDKDQIEKVRDKYKLPKQFAIYAGSVNWNKNIPGICQACIDAGVDLVLVGKGFEDTTNLNHPELANHRQFLKDYASNQLIHVLGYVLDEDLVVLFNMATVMVFASFYEGFGLPVLEAQACGLPVITSNLSSLPEITEDSALLVDPYKTDQITQAIVKVVSDEKLQARLVELGLNNVKRFSWAKTAASTKQVYYEAISH